MNKQQLEKLAKIGRRQTSEITQTPNAAKAFMIRAGIYTKAGALKESYGGGQSKKPAKK
jgi:hypothetical protein